MKRATIGGIKGVIRRSTRKGKKWMHVPDNLKLRTIHAGQKGAKIRPGTPAGNIYCKRSAKIKSKKRSPNTLARYMWNCKGGKSIGRKSKGL